MKTFIFIVMHHVCLTMGCVLVTFTAISQSWYGGLVLGVSNYQGDLIKEDFSFRALKPAIGATVRTAFIKGFSANVQFFHGAISGTDSYYPERLRRSLSFYSQINEFSIGVEYDLLHLFGKRYQVFPWSLKVIGGGGLLGFTMPTYLFSEKDQMNYEQTTETKAVHNCIHFGFSFGYQLNENTRIGYEMSHRSTLKDNLDGLQKIGGKNHADWYYLSNISITTRIFE